MRGHKHGIEIGPLSWSGECSEGLAEAAGLEVVFGFVLQIFEHEIIRQCCGDGLISFIVPLNIGIELKNQYNHPKTHSYVKNMICSFI